MSGMFLRWAT